MNRTIRLGLTVMAAAAMLSAADPYCPAYPSAVRTEMERSLSLDREFQAYSKSAQSRSRAASSPRLAASANVIDQLILDKMTAAGVDPAPRTTDRSHHIPIPAQILPGARVY